MAKRVALVGRDELFRPKVLDKIERRDNGHAVALAINRKPLLVQRAIVDEHDVGPEEVAQKVHGRRVRPIVFVTRKLRTEDDLTRDAALAYGVTDNDLNQLTDLSGQALTWDADGNLLSDGTRTYTWDAENRLLAIGYPGVGGKATSFTYDGLGRRVAITSTPPGGDSSVTTSCLWCGSAICQARDASDTTTRQYLTDGEYVPGTTPQPYYYGTDQIGSARRVFASTSSAPAFSYEPHGVPLQTTVPLTDFNYAGMFFNAESGLDLTQYRAYDPLTGRWLSRDPGREASNPVGNLYPYVDGNPVSLVDSLGLAVDPCGTPPACVFLLGGGAAVAREVVTSGVITAPAATMFCAGAAIVVALVVAGRLLSGDCG